MKLASPRDHEKVAKFIYAGDAAGASDAMRKLIQAALTLIQRATR